MDSTPASRPYRSHRVPACDKCRQRKIRCVIDAAGHPCRLCSERAFTCAFSGTRTSRHSAAPSERPVDSPDRSGKRTRVEHVEIRCRPAPVGRSPSQDGPAALIPDAPRPSRPAAQQPARPSLAAEVAASTPRQDSHVASAAAAESSIIVGPMVAEDVQILQQYLTAERRSEPQAKQPYSVVSNTPGNPMIYLAVPRHREGLKLANDPGRAQREILEQILGPNKQEVIRLYFRHIHPSFPVLDEDAFRDSHADGWRTSSSLLCEMYAISLTFWNHSDTLKHQHCPNEQYFWNLAIAALQKEFLAPNLSTLYPSIIDLLGRPVGSVQGNVVNAGRTVALAHSLGLNRDPRAWRTASREKDLRIRLFWGCMILDQWSSFAHGIPPSILRKQCDVPLPTIETLVDSENDSEEKLKAFCCFINLCKLSQILGDILPLVYDLSGPQKETWKDLRRLECDLDRWEERLPEYLQAGALENGVSVSGASSLNLGYLSIRMLLCRVALRSASQESSPDANDIRQYHLTTVRRAATQIADFMCSLQSCHLQEFWLSYTGHLLVSAATVLLRCAIDTTDVTIAEGCKNSLKSLQKRLHLARSQDNWDLADMFMKRCDEPISRITSVPAPGFETRNQGRDGVDTNDPSSSEDNTRQPNIQDVPEFGFGTYSELNIPIGPLDYPWESLWDMLEGG